MNFLASRSHIPNRGRAPVEFLQELVAWGKTAPGEIFEPNKVPLEAYTVLRPHLGTPDGRDRSGAPVFVWDSLLHRRAAMLELMRVHAGLESSWNWNEGVDRSNRTSMANVTGQETGIFQVSYDSTHLDSTEGKDIMAGFLKLKGVDGPDEFIPRMKADHAFALEYYARLVRVSIRWAGPLLRPVKDSVYPSLSRDSMREFAELLR